MLVLLFAIGDQEFALPAAEVVEVLPPVAMVRVPQAPAAFAGVIDLRGEPVPVLDPAPLIGLEPQGDRHYASRILLVRLADQDGVQRTVGLLTSRATEIDRCADCRRGAFLLRLAGEEDEERRQVQWFDYRRLVVPELVSTAFALLHPE